MPENYPPGYWRKFFNNDPVAAHRHVKEILLEIGDNYLNKIVPSFREGRRSKESFTKLSVETVELLMKEIRSPMTSTDPLPILGAEPGRN